MAAKVRVNFIGYGRVGKTMRSLLEERGVAEVGEVCNTAGAIPQLAEADIYFITTPDDQIASACQELLKNPFLPSEKDFVVLHCSGLLTSAATLGALKTARPNAAIASVHPAKSFADVKQSIDTFPGTLCTFEGDPKAEVVLKPIFEKLSGVFQTILPEHKALYHAACVMANNYIVTIFDCAKTTFESAGFDSAKAHYIALRFLNDAVQALSKHPSKEALTGPIQRGDAETIMQHLQVLKSNPLLLQIYKHLGKRTLPLTSHNNQLKNELEKLLS